MYRAEASADDFKYILNHLRNEDKKEVKMVYGKHWKKNCFKNLLNKDYDILLAKTKQGNIPVLMAGAWNVDKNNPSVAIVWMLSTPDIEKHQICFLREFKKELEKYDERFSITFNYLSKTNKLAKAWLKWGGYRFPAEVKKNKTFLDKYFLNAPVQDGFEVFYRERPIKGLGE